MNRPPRSTPGADRRSGATARGHVPERRSGAAERRTPGAERRTAREVPPRVPDRRRPATAPPPGSPATPSPAVPQRRTVVLPPAAAAARARVGRQVDVVLDAVAGDSGPRWVSGVLAALQAVLLSLLVVVLPALTAYVATSADPSNAEVGWTRAVAVGAALWLLGHGGALDVGGATVTLVPLGLTVLALFSAYASARRSAHPDRTAWWAGTAAYAGAAGAVVLLAGSAGPMAQGPGAVVRTLVGAALVGAVGLGLGLPRRARVLPWGDRWTVRVHHVASHAARGGVLATAMLVGAGAAVTVAWVLAGRAATGDVVEGLGVDTLGGILLAFAQLALAPNLVLWAVSWVVGPGFAVGSGTSFAPAGVVSGPLPALPMLGALPHPDSGGGALRWVPVVVVLVGVVVGLWLHRRLVPARAGHVLGAALGAPLAAGLLVAGASALAGGAAGPGRLAVVGASPLLVGAWVAVGSAAGTLAVALPASPLVRSAVATRFSRWTTRAPATGVGAAAQGVPVADAPSFEEVRPVDEADEVGADSAPRADDDPVRDDDADRADGEAEGTGAPPPRDEVTAEATDRA